MSHIKVSQAKRSEIDILAAFAYTTAHRNTSAWYPIHDSPGAYSRSLFRYLDDDRDDVFTAYCGGELIGVAALFTEPENMYAQISFWAYTCEAYLAFFEYIKPRLAGITIDFTYGGDNPEAMKFSKIIGGTIIEQSSEAKAFLDQTQSYDYEDSVLPLTISNCEDARRLYERYDAEMYWNASRVFEDLSKWRILLYFDNGEIHGLALIAAWISDEAHVYGVFYESITDYSKILRGIIYDTGARGIPRIRIDCETTEEEKAAIEAGFMITAKYKTLRLLLPKVE